MAADRRADLKAGAAQANWRAFPNALPLDVLNDGRTIILAPHPDDESLGCGGIIAALCAARSPPVIVVLTDGARSHPNSRLYPPKRLRAVRRAEAAAATAALGLPRDALHFLDLPDSLAPMCGPTFDVAVDHLAKLGVGCRTVLATWIGDPHGDHVAAHRMACALAGRNGLRHLAYPIWGWTLPPDADVPAGQHACVGWRVGIAEHLDAKRRAIACHASQLGTLITDDPSGVALPPSMLANFDRLYEVLLQT